MDAGALQDGAHRATGDHTGTGGCGPQEHDAGSGLAGDGMRDGALDPRHAEEALLGFLHALGDRCGHLLGLAVADTDHSVGVTHHDERGEAEAATALDHLGDAVDGHDALDEGALLGRLAAAVATTVVAVTPLAAAALGSGVAALRCSHQCILCFRTVMSRGAVTVPDRLRGRRWPLPRPARGTCCYHGRRPRPRYPRPWRARPPARRRGGPWRSCRRRGREDPPRALTRRPGSGRRRRRPPGPPCGGWSG